MEKVMALACFVLMAAHVSFGQLQISAFDRSLTLSWSNAHRAPGLRTAAGELSHGNLATRTIHFERDLHCNRRRDDTRRECLFLSGSVDPR